MTGTEIRTERTYYHETINCRGLENLLNDIKDEGGKLINVLVSPSGDGNNSNDVYTVIWETAPIREREERELADEF